jgi:GAF domain-containing protein
VQPLPETVEALRELTRFGDETIARTLWRISSEVQRIVPEIVGVSLSLATENVTFTMTAGNQTVAKLDGVQYLAGGPCEETMETGVPREYRAGDVVDEERWQSFARATAASGVQSTLSLPILREGIVVAGVNMYASTADAFEGRHEELASVCGAWAGGAVKNADLDFTTRFEAAETPERLRSERWVDQAVGVVMSRWGLSMDEAEERLRRAAERAGISDAEMARAVIGLFSSASGSEADDEAT